MKNFSDLLLIKPGEGRMTAYFMLLFICMGVSIAIAKGSADALFLRRYGVENLAFVYLVLAVVLALTFTLYAAYVDRIASEKFFSIILLLQLATLLFSWIGMNVTQLEFIYPLYYVLYSLSSELLLVHGAFYLGQNLDTLQSKRLTPVVFGGYQLGMIVGGLVLIFVISGIGLNLAPLIWGGFTIVALLMMARWHKREGVSPYFFPKGKSRKNRVLVAINEVARGLEFIRSVDLLRNAAWALVFLVITFYMLSYSAHTIYSVSFESEHELTRFFGLLVIFTNLSAMIMQIFISSRIVELIGVRKAKLIFPITTVISFVFFILHPGFLAALFASFNRETIMPAIRNPTREMFFNILPAHMKGRSRAISVAVVMPIALCCCGLLILFIQQEGDLQMIALAGLALAIMYLILCIRMGKNYLATLINSMREKLFLPENMAEIYRDSSNHMIEELTKGLNSKDDDVSLSYAKALSVCYPDRATDLIIERVHSAEVDIADQLLKLIPEDGNNETDNKLLQLLSRGDDHFKATIYAAVFKAGSQNNEEMIRQTINTANPRIRSAGVIAAVNSGNRGLLQEGLAAWDKLLNGDDEDNFSSFELIPCLESLADEQVREKIWRQYSTLLPKYILQAGKSRRISIYGHLLNWPSGLPAEISDKVVEDLGHYSPKVRVAAVRLLRLLPGSYPVTELVWRALDDGHQSVRNVALEIVKARCENRPEQFFEWILSNTMGTPRAQKVLLDDLVRSEATNAMLEQVAEAKTSYASELFLAYKQLDAEKPESIELGLLKILLEERFHQVVDIALLAVQPLLESNVIAVIRAGIDTKNSRYQSDALEALSCIDDSPVTKRLSILVSREYSAANSPGVTNIFRNIREVVAWCANSKDPWIRQNGINAQKALEC